eukprot:jgi/Psemu1/25248/gm1.25248_g
MTWPMTTQDWMDPQVRSPFKEEEPRRDEQEPCVGKTEEIKNDTFVLGPMVGGKWLTSCEAFIEYAAHKYGEVRKPLSSMNLKETIIGTKKPTTYREDQYSKLKGIKLKGKWKMDYRRYTNTENTLAENLTKLYDILWNQCEPAMKNKKIKS